MSSSGSGGTITVNITAQETELRAALALSKAELSKFSSEVKSLSSQMVATGSTADVALRAALKSATTDAANAAASVDDFEQQLKKLNPTLNSTHGSISTATREFRALFDEITSGRTRQTPGTLAIIAQRVFGLGPAALLAVGGIGILAAGLAYLTIKALETANAIDKIHLSGLGTEGFAASEAEIKKYIDLLSQLPEVSSKDAEKIVAAFQTMQNRSVGSLQGLSAATTSWADLSGQEYEKAAEQLKKVFGAPATAQAREFMVSLSGVTTAEIQAYEKAREAGDVYAMQGAMLQALSGTIDKNRDALVKHSASIHDNWRNFGAYLLLIEGGMTPQQAENALIEDSAQKYDQLAASIRGATAALQHQQETPRQKLDDVLIQGEKINTTRTQISQLTEYIKKAKEELKTSEGKTFAKQINEDLKEAETRLESLKNKQQFKGTGFSNAGQESIAQAHEQISEINATEGLGAKERVALIEATYRDILAHAKLNKAQRIEVQIDLNKELASAEKQNQRDALEIEKDNSRTSLELSRISIQKKRDELEAEVQAGKLTEQEKLRQLEDLVKEEERLNLKALDDSKKKYDEDGKDFARVENEKKLLKARTAAELAKLDEQIVVADKKAAELDARNWRSSVNEITSSVTQFEDNLITGRKSALQSLQQLTSSFIRKEIEQDTAYYLRKMLLSKEAFAAEKTEQQGGFLVHLLTETKKTATTVSGTAARTTAQKTGEVAENSSLLVKGARWLATELGMTTATTVQETARTAETVAAAGAQATAKEAALVATKASEIAANVTAAESYIGVAATGAAAAVAFIPIVGPELALAAAASTTAALQPYAALASLDVGAWNVPRDMPAMIHQGESVVPKQFATGLRENGGFGAGRNSSTTTNTVNLSYQPQVQNDPSKSLEQHLASDGHAMRAWLRNEIRNGSLRF